MHPVFLNFAGGDLGKSEIPKEGQEMNTKADTVPFDPPLAALALGNDLIFFEELIRSLPASARL